MRDEEWNTWEGGWRIISRDKWHFCSPIYCIYPIRIANSVFHNKQTHTHTCGAQCIGEGMGIGGVRVWPCGADVEGLMGMVEWGWCLWLLRISATRLLRGLLLPSIYLHWTIVHCWNPCNWHRHKIYSTRQFGIPGSKLSSARYFKNKSLKSPLLGTPLVTFVVDILVSFLGDLGAILGYQRFWDWEAPPPHVGKNSQINL